MKASIAFLKLLGYKIDGGSGERTYAPAEPPGPAAPVDSPEAAFLRLTLAMEGQR